NTRWLQEIYPVDAVLAKQLGIADSLITFTPTRVARPVYTVRVLDRGGAELLRESFDPKYVIRPFFDLFPEYESVRVTTGWVTVIANGDTVLDRRIRTDPEAFWDHFQQKTYARIIEYVMNVQDGRPAPANAPYFDELRVDLTLSEPNYRIGIDEEVVSSAEALHEDIYFETLTLFSLLGNRYDVGSLDFIGRVLPHITPPVHGKPGRARIVLTGKERAEPELVMTWRERGQEPVSQRYALGALPVDAPKLRGMAVRAGGQRVERALFEVVALDSVDRYDEHKGRGSEGQIDRMFLPAPTLSGMVAIISELHTAGILEDALSYDRIGELKFRFALRDTLAAWQSSKALRQSRRPRSTRNPVLHDSSFAYRGQRIVQWQTPIPPAESDSVLARLATFPTVNVYYVAKSFLGQNIFAADFLPPSESRYVSQAKLNALKPTLFLSGRQHANEVSSTSHILRLGELLATDSTYTRLLRRANVVLHPVTNPDGARLAYEMQKVNPDFMLHAGYLGALGVDATSGANTPDPIYPESLVRPELMETWLPDIYVNMHGYPSHEWVQYFAGYSAWVRSRRGAQRSWWAPRGWFIPGFNWVDDARYPELKKAQFAVLDSIAQSITAVPAVQAMNQRMYARYQKYGRQDVENFREYFHNGILVSLALRGREATGQGVNNPRVNYISITTEAPDETARGAWLELVASAGLAHSSALLRYLANGTNEIKRESSEYEQFVIRSVFRKKPVLPKEPKATNSP
ncbi:MAG TPA: M14 family metallopeptidase, partial [Longimicrobiales bacterium]|nr:M14 family metallopeptidase [Longimicrobiales bacterium]